MKALLLLLAASVLLPSCAIRLKGDVELALVRKYGTKETTKSSEATMETSLYKEGIVAEQALPTPCVPAAAGSTTESETGGAK